MNPISQFFEWYGRIGAPVEFHTALSVKACMQRLQDATADWDSVNPFGVKPYKAMILHDGRFKLKRRRGVSERPFEGRLTALPEGGTRVHGTLKNDMSHLGFVSFVLVIAPLVGVWLGNRPGLMVGLVIGISLIAVTIFARIAEDNTRAPKALRQWLYETLDRRPDVVEGKVAPPKLPPPR